MSSAVEGPDGVAGPPTRPPVVTAGVDGNGAIRRLLTDTTGAIKIAAGVTLTAESIEIGTVDQGTAGLSPWLVAINGVPHVIVDSATLGTVTVDASGHTIPVSAVALPLPAGAAKDSTLTDGTQRVGGTVAVSIASLPAVTFASPQHVVVDSATLGTVTVAEHTVDQGTAGTSAWKVDGSAVTQPVSASALPLPTGASTDASVIMAGMRVREAQFDSWLAREEAMFQ